ncbi:hypothetical protein PVAP13_2KG595601 [Panicum virgatum]|uniref:Uncharacterized protein n=1 Tax=Panicum virgatum TaxID=38727 RepID=A0A8T0WP00_PANVG|nr:hypothetical protein PVAP13_2KG595601 [Panicum virgatum]
MRQGILELRTEAGCCALGRRTGLVAAGAGGGVSWERRKALEAGVGAASSAISGGSMDHGFGLPFLLVAARPSSAFPHAGAPCCLLSESEAKHREWRRCPVASYSNQKRITETSENCWVISNVLSPRRSSP